MIKAVIDTNVFLSALFWNGKPKQVIELALEKKIVGVTAPEILSELEEKLILKFKYPKNQTDSYLKLIIENFEVVKPKIKVDVVKEDSDDNKIIDAALESKAKYIVTGDKHLLNIDSYQKIIIMTPNQFIQTTTKH